jgi:hypothetical protein
LLIRDEFLEEVKKPSSLNDYLAQDRTCLIQLPDRRWRFCEVSGNGVVMREIHFCIFTKDEEPVASSLMYREFVRSHLRHLTVARATWLRGAIACALGDLRSHGNQHP